MRERRSAMCLENPQTTRAREIWREALSHLGIEHVADHYSDANHTLATALRSFRRFERAQVLGAPDAEMYRAMGERDLRATGRHFSAARNLLQERLRSNEWVELAPRLNGLRSSPQGQAAFTEAQERWGQLLIETDMRAEDAKEAAGMWDRVMQRLDAGGATGLLEAMDGWLAEMLAEHRPESDYGRRPHSPQCFNAWLCMIFALGLLVAALLSCLFWGACTWIFWLFIAVAEAGVIASCLSVC
jgi:hypothetical protein